MVSVDLGKFAYDVDFVPVTQIHSKRNQEIKKYSETLATPLKIKKFEDLTASRPEESVPTHGRTSQKKTGSHNGKPAEIAGGRLQVAWFPAAQPLVHWQPRANVERLRACDGRTLHSTPMTALTLLITSSSR